MKIKITEEKENPLLHRKEIKAVITEIEKTPSREEVKKQIAAQVGKDEKTILLDEIKQEFGKKEATTFVKVYEKPEDLQKYEQKYMVKRNNLVEEKKEEAPKEEKPVDEKQKEESEVKEAAEEVKEETKETPKEE